MISSTSLILKNYYKYLYNKFKLVILLFTFDYKNIKLYQVYFTNVIVNLVKLITKRYMDEKIRFTSNYRRKVQVPN